MKTAYLPFYTVLSFYLFSFNVSIGQSTFYKNYNYGAFDSQVFNICPMSDGSYAMIGIAETSNGSSEAALTKLNCDGSVAWAKLFGSSSTINNIVSQVIEADNGDIIFINNVGAFQGYDFIVGRLSSDGTTIWKKRYGGNRNDMGRGIVQTQDGHLAIIGSTGTWGTDSNASSNSYSDVYLLKIDQNDGAILWTKTLGNFEAIDAGYAIKEDSEGNLFAVGRYLVGGTFYAFLLKTDAVGEVQFFKGYGYPNHRTYSYDLTLLENGNIALTGSTTINKEGSY